MTTRMTIRIDLPNGQVGPGKIGLLEQVAATGSIRKSAGAMKMSYRRAWLLLQSLEACFGAPLVETVTGGRKGGGARLSKLGGAVVRAYRRAEVASAKAGKAELQALTKLAARRSKAGTVK
jgi:molybdate transport system regulatory protein